MASNLSDDLEAMANLRVDTFLMGHLVFYESLTYYSQSAPIYFLQIKASMTKLPS
jgi:hypothetical protein